MFIIVNVIIQYFKITKINPMFTIKNYIKGLSDEMSRILRKFNINVYTYPYKTIGNILPKIKDSVNDI